MRATSVLRATYRHDQTFKKITEMYLLNLVSILIKLHIYITLLLSTVIYKFHSLLFNLVA